MNKNEIKEMLQKTAFKSMFQFNEEELEYACNEYEVFMNQVEKLQHIDTTNVEVMTFPYEIETTYMRDDEPNHIVDRDDLLSNSNDIIDNQVRVIKVVR